MNHLRTLICILCLIPLPGTLAAATYGADSAAAPPPAVESDKDDSDNSATSSSPRAGQQQMGGGPWGHPDVLKAAAAIKMNMDQQAVFRGAVGTFVDQMMQETMSLTKRGKPDLQRELKRVRRKLARDMDETMRGTLDDVQYPRYEEYRTLLLGKMSKMGGRKRR